MKKYPALKRHICRFNDGDNVCECFDKGYKKTTRELKKLFYTKGKELNYKEDNPEACGYMQALIDLKVKLDK
jgi:hypothetical protein